MTTPVVSEQAATIEEWHLREFMEIFARRKVAFLQVFLLVLGMGFLAATRGKPIYVTSAKLLVPVSSGSVNIVDSNNPIATMLMAAQPDSLATQLEVLQSAPFLSEAYQKAKVVPR